jgi:hypothetical protein
MKNLQESLQPHKNFTLVGQISPARKRQTSLQPLKNSRNNNKYLAYQAFKEQSRYLEKLF